MKIINIHFCNSNGLKWMESIFQKQVRYFDKIIFRQILVGTVYTKMVQ